MIRIPILLTLCCLLFTNGCGANPSPPSQAAAAATSPPKTSSVPSSERNSAGTNDAVAANVIVTVSDARPLGNVVRDLEQRGLFVEQALEPSRIVTGKVAQRDLNGLRSVSGVVAVELETMFEVASPSSGD